MMPPDASRDARATGAAPAAPTGGAHQEWWGWGCGLGRFSTIFSGIVLGLCAPLAAHAQQPGAAMEVPSGQPVTLTEVLLDTDPGALWVRFRFVAPRIQEGAGAVSHDVTALDMDHLCNVMAVPWLLERAVIAERIVISFASQDLALGMSDPTITQYFEFYRPEGTACIWEEY